MNLVEGESLIIFSMSSMLIGLFRLSISLSSLVTYPKEHYSLGGENEYVFGYGEYRVDEMEFMTKKREDHVIKEKNYSGRKIRCIFEYSHE